MPLSEYVRILYRRGWILLLLAILTAAAAFVFSRLQTPVYKSTIYLLVQPSRSDFGLTQSAKQLLRSYVAWIDTDRVAANVIGELQMDKEPSALRSDVTIASDDSRLVIQIDVENENGDLANDIALAWANQFVIYRNDENQKQRAEDRVSAVILDAPKYGLDRPNTTINTVAGAILGILLGGVIVFILEAIDSAVIRSPADIERQFKLPVLGAIPVSERKR
jgi:capsular polysaccharide biosynthesis protein